MKIAVVGAGISGLVAAHLLHEGNELTVFEASERPGGHTRTSEVPHAGRTLRIDTGFIVFNERHYPHFTRLLARLGVESQPTSMSFSVRCDRTGIEWNGSSLGGVFAQRRNIVSPRLWRMLRDIVRFSREAARILDAPDERVTVAEHLAALGYSDEFAELYLVPLGASLWSCPPARFRHFPIAFVVEFLANHSMLGIRGRPEWRVVRGGSSTYVERLIRPFRDRIRLACQVRSVSRGEEGVRITAGRSGEAATEAFDHAIMACHADQALGLLADPSPVEREILGAFPYQANEATLHTDDSVLPRARRAWASWNYHRRAQDPDRVAVTYDMNILQELEADATFCVTLNEGGRIAPEKIVERVAYEHPLYLAGRAAAQRRLPELIGHRRTSYCGAYWGYGFHEDGVRSALAVAAPFGRSL